MYNWSVFEILQQETGQHQHWKNQYYYFSLNPCKESQKNVILLQSQFPAWNSWYFNFSATCPCLIRIASVKNIFFNISAKLLCCSASFSKIKLHTFWFFDFDSIMCKKREAVSKIQDRNACRLVFNFIE